MKDDFIEVYSIKDVNEKIKQGYKYHSTYLHKEYNFNPQLGYQSLYDTYRVYILLLKTKGEDEVIPISSGKGSKAPVSTAIN